MSRYKETLLLEESRKQRERGRNETKTEDTRILTL